MTLIRRLGPEDAAAMWNLRLRALEEAPQAFASSADEHRATTVETVARRLTGRDSFVVGAFDGDTLIGMCGFHRADRAKRRHKGVIWGVFVAREVRGKGIARQMLERAIEYARQLDGLISMYLTVSVTQEAAVRLYRSLGFQSFGFERRALKVGDEYIDEQHMELDL